MMIYPRGLVEAIEKSAIPSLGLPVGLIDQFPLFAAIDRQSTLFSPFVNTYLTLHFRPDFSLFRIPSVYSPALFHGRHLPFLASK